jgi:phenylacetate-CoA ligase
MVVTCFLTKSTPLIRYKIEDMAVYSDTKCECGRSSIVIDEILGRLDDVLITPEKGAVGRLSTSFKLLPPVIRRAQIRQMAPDRFDLLLEADSGDIQPGLIDPVLSDLEDKLGKVNITVKYVKEIPAGANGKFRSQIKCF